MTINSLTSTQVMKIGMPISRTDFSLTQGQSIHMQLCQAQWYIFNDIFWNKKMNKRKKVYYYEYYIKGKFMMDALSFLAKLDAKYLP